jgi:PIN domain nuclease of toxin-antitoxin system
VRLLLDTHILLWALGDVGKLSAGVSDAIRDPENAVVVSAATAWEIAIKQSLGKLTLPAPAERWLLSAIETLHAEWLPVEPAHALATRALPWHHRDPFDRLLVAQAMTGLLLVTHDSRFEPYKISVLWN